MIFLITKKLKNLHEGKKPKPVSTVWKNLEVPTDLLIPKQSKCFGPPDSGSPQEFANQKLM